MILKWMAIGLPVAGFFAAGTLAAQADAPQAGETRQAAESRSETGDARKTTELSLVEGGKAAENDKNAVRDAAADEDDKTTTFVIDGEEIARDVEKAVGEAVSGAMEALEDIEADIRIELDGERLDALSKEYRQTLGEARERLRDMGDRLAEHAAEVEVQVTRAGEKAAEAVEEAGKALRETRVIVLRGGMDSQVRIEKDDKGRTVVVIEGDDVRVITREKPGETDKPDGSPE